MCSLKKALRLFYPVKVILYPTFPLPSSGVKKTKGKTQLFILLPSCPCPSPALLYLSGSNPPQIFSLQSHVWPSIPFLNFKINTFLPSTALFGGSKRVACSTGALAGPRKEPNAHNAPTPSLTEVITAYKSTV